MDSTGLVYKQYRNISVQTSSTYVTYKLNTSLLTLVDSKRHVLDRKCPELESHLQHYDSVSQDTPNWNLTNNYKIKSKSPIWLAFKDLNQFQNLSTCNCDVLSHALERTIMFKQILNGLASGDIDSLYFLESKQNFQAEVLKVLRTFNQISPITQELFYTEIWKYAKLHYNYLNEYAYIEIEIPLFGTQSTLFEVFSRPIIHNNNAYKFNLTNMDYVVLNSNKSIVLSRKMYSQNCHIFLNLWFCTHVHQTPNVCNKLVTNNFSGTFQDECFIRMENQNMISQMGKTIYFTIFSPIVIQFSQYGTITEIPVTFSSKITENINYNISSTFFNFHPLDYEKYEIFYEPQQVKSTLYKMMLTLVPLVPIAVILGLFIFSLYFKYIKSSIRQDSQV